MFYQPIPHTADIGFKVWGQTLEELFENAARAMVDNLVVLSDAKPDKTIFVQLTAESREELLVKWLEEILYHFETESFVGIDFNVTRCDPADFKATLHGIEWDPARQPLKTQIKAVTFHELAIHKTGGQFEVQVILDV